MGGPVGSSTLGNAQGYHHSGAAPNDSTSGDMGHIREATNRCFSFSPPPCLIPSFCEESFLLQPPQQGRTEVSTLKVRVALELDRSARVPSKEQPVHCPGAPPAGVALRGAAPVAGAAAFPVQSVNAFQVPEGLGRKKTSFLVTVSAKSFDHA